MTQHVISFVGQNANGILDWWTRQIHARLAEIGISGVLIDLLSPSWQGDVITEVNRKRPSFVFSFQGYGTGVTTDGRNLWDVLDIPVICSMGDAPYHAPALHRAVSQRQILLYACQDFFDAYRTYMDGASLSAVVPFGFPENPLVDETPWEQRGQAVVYVKSGNDPKAFAREWMAAPALIRTILHDAATTALSGSPMTIADLCAAAFRAHGVHWGHRREIFLRVCAQVDMFVRAVRAERMAQHLMQRPDAVIIGSWPQLDRTQARAVFRDAIPAAALHALYADTKVLVNTMPSVRTGVHERIMSGLLSKCAVLSDTTPGLQAQLGQITSLSLVDLDRGDYPAQIDAALDAQLGTRPDLETAYSHAVQNFSTDAFIRQVFQFLEADIFSQASLPWRFAA